MTSTFDRRRALVGIFVATLLASCASPPPPPPPLPHVSLTIQAGKDQNAGADGVARSVAVRLYWLGGTTRFARADFFALHDQEKAVLADDGMGSEELILSPGSSQTLERDVKAGVQNLGVVVAFYDIDHATWRATAPVAASGVTKLVLTTSAKGVTLAPG